MLKWRPGQLAFVRPGAYPAREPQPLGVEGLDYSAGRTGAGEGGEQVAHGVLDAGVRVEHHLAGRVVDEACGQDHRQFAPAGFGKLATPQPGADEMKLCLRERPFEPEQHPVVELGGVVKPVLVTDQRVGEGTDLQ